MKTEELQKILEERGFTVEMARMPTFIVDDGRIGSTRARRIASVDEWIATLPKDETIYLLEMIDNGQTLTVRYTVESELRG